MTELAEIRPTDLIAKFQEALNDTYGYIYGKTHEKWSAEKQSAYNKAKQGVSECQNSIRYGPKWYGHWVTDCSGLFAWAFSQLGGYMYHGSNTMYRDYCTAKGALNGGKRTDGQELKPGTAVFTGTETKHGHVGLYIGGGEVIEAEGAQHGVVKSKVTKSKWTYWGELKGVNYSGVTPAPTPTPTPTPTPVPAGKAVVTGKAVALREGPSTSTRVQIRIATGTTVNLAKIEGWTYVRSGTKYGFMMNEFIDVKSDSVTATGKNVAVREGTGTNCRVITRIPTGKTIPRAELPKDWDYIEYGGKKGFMMAQFIRKG